MKCDFKILFFFTIGFISCTNVNDHKYENLLNEIHKWEKTTKYDYPVFDYINDLDSISKRLLNDLPNISPEDLKSLERFSSMTSLNDSTKSRIRDYLTFNTENSSSKFIMERVKQVRLWYTSEVLDYLNKVENDSSFKSLIVHRYSLSEGDSIFRTFNVFVPTSDGYSMINPLNPCRWLDLKHNGISIQFNDYQRIDTIGFKIQWYDKKFKDTLNSVLLQIK